MLGESWLSEVLGSDAEHLNPTRVQEPATKIGRASCRERVF